MRHFSYGPIGDTAAADNAVAEAVATAMSVTSTDVTDPDHHGFTAAKVRRWALPHGGPEPQEELDNRRRADVVVGRGGIVATQVRSHGAELTVRVRREAADPDADVDAALARRVRLELSLGVDPIVNAGFENAFETAAKAVSEVSRDYSSRL